MAKVSIGLRGWRFPEEAVLDADGNLRPVDEMPPDTAERVSRLADLVGYPCDVCWLRRGGPEGTADATVIYGEPGGEVLLCDDHEPDFLYWYRVGGGDAHRGTDALQDAFHEWIVEGGRAPEDFGGIEHVDTDPESIPVRGMDGKAPNDRVDPGDDAA